MTFREEVIVFTTGIIPGIAFAVIVFSINSSLTPDVEDGEGWIGFFTFILFVPFVLPIHAIIWRAILRRRLRLSDRGLRLLPYAVACVVFNIVFMFLAMSLVR